MPGDYTQIDTFHVSFGLQLLFSIYVLLCSFHSPPPAHSPLLKSPGDGDAAPCYLAVS